MKLTNKHGLPEAFVRASQGSIYRPSNNFSPSTLAKSPRQYWLYKRHWDELEEDVSNRVWAIMGTAVHTVLERGHGENELNEQYLKEPLNGFTISGVCDNYNAVTCTVSDYKVTSVWSIIYDKSEEWEKQLNVYAWLYRKAGFEVDSLEVVALLRDWKKRQAKYDKKYPQSNVRKIKIKLWTDEQTENYLMERIASIMSEAVKPDDELTPCTMQEKWEDPTIYAVMKKGRKASLKNCYSMEEAEKVKAAKGADFIEVRKGEATNCLDYCPVSQFCNQFKEEQVDR